MDKSMRGKTRDFVDLDNGSCLAKMPAATAEQLNIAKILSKPGDNIDISYYVAQLQELTSCTEDQAVTALYDCENNLERAVELVLDKFRCGADDEWHTTGRKSRESEPPTLHSSVQEEDAENCRLRKTKTAGSVRSELSVKSSSPCPPAEVPKVEEGRSAEPTESDWKVIGSSDAAGRDYKTRSKVSEFDEYGEWGGEAIEVVNSNAYIPRENPAEETLRDELFVDIENNQEPYSTETIHSVDKTVKKSTGEEDSANSLFVSRVFSKQPPPAFTNLPNDAVFVVPELFSRTSRWSAKFGGELCVQSKLSAACTSAVNSAPSKEPACNQTSQSKLPNLSKDQANDPQIYPPYMPSPSSKSSASNFDINKPGSARSLLETPTPSDKKTDLISSNYATSHFQNASATPNVTAFSASQKPQSNVAFNAESGGDQSGYLESSLKNYLLESLPKEMNKLSVGDVPQNPKTSQFNMQSVQQSQQTVTPPFSHTQGSTTATLQHHLGKVPMSHISPHGSLHSTQQPMVSGASHQPQTAALPPGMPHFISQFAPPAYHMFNLPGSSGNQPTIFELDQLQFLQQQQRLLYDMHLQQQSSTTAQSLTSSAEAASAGKPSSHNMPGTLGHVTAGNAGIRPDLLASAMGHAPQMMPPGHPYFSYPGFVVMNGYANAFLNQQQQSGQDSGQVQTTGHGGSPITQHQTVPTNSTQSYGSMKALNPGVSGYDDLFDMKYGDPTKQVGFKNSIQPAGAYGPYQGQVTSTETVASKMSACVHPGGALAQGYGTSSGGSAGTQPFSASFYPSAASPYLTAAAAAVAAAAAAAASAQQQASNSGNLSAASVNQSNTGGTTAASSSNTQVGGGSGGPNQLHMSANQPHSMGQVLHHAHHHQHQRQADPKRHDSEFEARDCTEQSCQGCWYSHVRSYGFYNPIMAGSIDGTDVTPHDRAIIRALSSGYKPRYADRLARDPKATLFIGRLPLDVTQSVLEQALSKLLHTHDHLTEGIRHAGASGTSLFYEERRSRKRHRSRSPFCTSSGHSSPKADSDFPKVRIVRHIVTGYPCGYAFAYFRSRDDAERVLRNWLQRTRSRSTDFGVEKPHGLDIPAGEKVILEPAFSETLPGWCPRRLGGGLGGRKEAGQLRFGGTARPFRRPFLI
ncbi:hypothetical protein P879_06919 [Paragonimus westermani]|uniref:RRM domain-containing protein n=1 Tax=Paragonimus westermani TaxID=34504 RepID=A0A8T0D096_9TREM|nr:hypothetical protein P879_06919 [Paragonimus westermani]